PNHNDQLLLFEFRRSKLRSYCPPKKSNSTTAQKLIQKKSITGLGMWVIAEETQILEIKL
ncbi:MAG: hypothetical protein ACXWM7_07830, partial [Parachlamydiaceae bacterium]